MKKFKEIQLASPLEEKFSRFGDPIETSGLQIQENSTCFSSAQIRRSNFGHFGFWIATAHRRYALLSNSHHLSHLRKTPAVRPDSYRSPQSESRLGDPARFCANLRQIALRLFCKPPVLTLYLLRCSRGSEPEIFFRCSPCPIRHSRHGVWPWSELRPWYNRTP